MPIIWLPSQFYTPGRPWGISKIVDHWTTSSLTSTIATFTGMSADVSAHYVVSREGEIIQFVREEDRAWTNGSLQDASVIEGHQSWNDISIQIEHEHIEGQDWPEAQLVASLWLHRDIRQRRKIWLTHANVLGHNETGYNTRCPGDLPIERFREDDMDEETKDIFRQMAADIRELKDATLAFQKSSLVAWLDRLGDGRDVATGGSDRSISHL